ncbi:AAA family ATPase [Streptomyces sp. NPDC090127]|uniref:helix-turn-helix transcriptional regulator n=1 Tax=Streptomyces sp. NPDC090127 TaxID=3365953 RepID=UPI0038251061
MPPRTASVVLDELTPPPHPHLICEREEQLSVMRRLLGEALGGNSRIAVVSGAAGHGKTELLAALAEEAGLAGVVHLSATASRMERYVPFGVLAQLFRGVELPPAAAGHVAHLLDRALSADAANVQDAVAIPPRLFHQMGTALHDLVKYVERPLLISVDDVEYADTPSLLCLSSLTRRLRATPLLLVLNELPSPRRSSTLLRAELPPEPVCHRVRLPPLSLDGVRALLAARLGAGAAQALGTECLAATGGNPFLVRGLVEDSIAATTRGPAPALSAGTLFEQAVLGCLYRCATSVRTIARIMAVLHDPRYVPLLVQLPGTHPQSLNLALGTLEETGLLSDGAWRHPDARTAVLHDMTPEARAELHTRIGTLLFKNGAPVTAVAHHLVAASQIDNDCAAAVLLEAAQEGLSTGDTTLATDCLSVAYRYDRSKEHFTATTAMLFRTEWRSDPRTAARRLPSLLEAARCGLLTGRHVAAPVDALLWFGRPRAALDLLEQMERHARLRQDAEASATLRRCRTTLVLLYPAMAEEEGDTTAAAGESYVPPAATRGQTLVELERVLRDGPGPLSALCAEQALVSHRLDDDTLIPLVLAVSTLIFNGVHDSAEQWIDSLSAAARSRSAPIWQALFESLRASLALHRGDPAEAARLAERALAEMPAAGWGIHIGLPLTVTLEAYTVLGSHDRALAQLQVEPPEAMFQTLLGACYLRARGNALLASGQSQAALDDFAAVGELATRWQMDVPALLPWRTDVARAHLARGELARARELAAEQSVLVGPGHHEARSLTLRTLAATAPPQERIKLLGQALEAAQKCGNTLELAYTFSALSRCHLDTGQYSKGRMALRRARQLAERSGVPLPARTPPEGGRRPQELAAVVTGGEKLVGVLSDAEMRVVALAVRGHSNRQIAAKLFVTVSTVEQHLTRVYRKLGIKRRSDLALAVNGEGGPVITTRRAS